MLLQWAMSPPVQWVKNIVHKFILSLQINLYLLSRVVYGLGKLLIQKKVIPQPKTDVFPWFAAIMWGLTLWLFEYQRSCLQPSLVSSMTYIYKDSDKWTNLRDFLIYNQWEVLCFRCDNCGSKDLSNLVWPVVEILRKSQQNLRCCAFTCLYLRTF